MVKFYNILNEKDLVEQCVRHNSNAQTVLYNKYLQKMMAICLRYLKSEEDASEVLNNAFLKVFSKIKQYKSEGSLEGWIKRIVINSSLDFIRSNKEYKNIFILTNEFPSYGSPDETDHAADDFSVAALHLSQEEVFEMVGELPPATRVVFNLYVIDDFAHKEIAQQLNLSVGTSTWHLSNARKLMKEKINQAVLKKNKNFSYGTKAE
ncbi:MAG: RNA polymerase sigma factor [Bacteroidia bacterium]